MLLKSHATGAVRSSTLYGRMAAKVLDEPNSTVDFSRTSIQMKIEQFRFRLSCPQFIGWKAFVDLLSRPTDAASLAVIRILFGLLMMLDIPQERGLSRLHEVYSSSPSDVVCHFPLFDFIRPLPLQWMYVVYLLMFAGAMGIALGFLYRMTSAIFVITYWYVFLLNTIHWNNHSFLYGLLGTLLMFTRANRCWSLDATFISSSEHSEVPLWNYTLIRAQIFLVYFIAGLKKTDRDWLNGYPMRHLSSHWVFAPFRLVLSEEMTDLHIVHHFGFAFDLSIGFLMVFDKTRPAAFLVCATFNLMNSQLFHIGMFPYVMLATMPIFCRPDWPRRLFRIQSATPSKMEGPSGTKKNTPIQVTNLKNRSRGIQGHQDLWAVGLTVAYIVFQLFLPYSHFITQGYNHWSHGLYGYSWDMMVHSWRTQHVRVTVQDGETGRVRFIDPEKFVPSKRWTRYARLAQQFARCVGHHMHVRHNASDDVKIFVDVWASLNGRFVQRMFDPSVDLLASDWSVFRKTTWTMPLLEDLSKRWRHMLDQDLSSSEMMTFVADFPGFFMENSMRSEWLHPGNGSIIGTMVQSDCSLEVLEGELIVEIMQISDNGHDHGSNVTVHTGDTVHIPINQMHRIHVVSDFPAAYVYKAVGPLDTLKQQQPPRITKMAVDFWREKYKLFKQSFQMTSEAIGALAWGDCSSGQNC